MKRLLVTLTIALLSAACAANDSQDAAGPADLLPSTVPSGVLATILDGEALDPEKATDVASFFAADVETRLVEPGPYYADSFSTPVVFELPVKGFLAQVGRGLVVVEVGEDRSDWDSVVAILELVAYAGVDGPIPIGDVAPDEAWGGATKLDSGIVESPNGPITWVDVIYEADNIDESRTFACPYEAENPCVDAYVIEQNGLVAELNRPHRYVNVEIDGERFVVASVWPRFSDEELYTQLPIDVAASLTVTTAREGTSGGPRNLEELSIAGSPIPAGTWVGNLNGSALTLSLDQDLEGAKSLGVIPQTTSFSNLDESETLTFFVFQRFVPAVDMRIPTLQEPLTNDEYFRGLGQVIEVTEQEETTIGGLPAVRYETGDEHDPAFACADELRSEIGLNPEAQCSVWATSDLGPLGLDDEEGGTPQDVYYIESVGLLVLVPVDEADPDGVFAELLDSIELAPRS